MMYVAKRKKKRNEDKTTKTPATTTIKRENTHASTSTHEITRAKAHRTQHKKHALSNTHAQAPTNARMHTHEPAHKRKHAQARTNQLTHPPTHTETPEIIYNINLNVVMSSKFTKSFQNGNRTTINYFLLRS